MFSVFALLASVSLSAQDVTAIFNEGAAAYGAKDFAGAAAKFEQVIEQGIDNPDAASLVATAKASLPRCYFMQGGNNVRTKQYDEALANFEKSAELAELYGDMNQASKSKSWVAKIYQKLAVKCQSGWAELMQVQERMIAEYKAAGRRAELQEAIRQLHCSFKTRRPAVPQELSYLEGRYRDDYLNDMRLCQRWAEINRRMITGLIIDWLTGQGFADTEACLEEPFESVHNYIGADNIIRKGAIAAYEGQRCIIPINMRDGSLICVGKGNADWNCSAPHGAGRRMSRAEAFRTVSLDDYAQSMQGIYTESVSEETKDEAPIVYKPKEEIIENIRDTVTVVNIIKPVYNFKAAE